jgi:hypothetical protein
MLRGTVVEHFLISIEQRTRSAGTERNPIAGNFGLPARAAARDNNDPLRALSLME